MKTLKYDEFLFESMKNEDVIIAYVNGATKASSKHLYIEKASKDTYGLKNYGTWLLYKTKEGDWLLNTKKYSVTTSKIQNYIKRNLTGINYIETDDEGIKTAIDIDYKV